MVLAAQIATYGFYRRSRSNPLRRSPLLYSMLFSQVFVWTLLGASLILCTMFLSQYAEGQHGIVRLVFGYSLFASLGVSGAMTVLARKFALPRALDRMAEGPNRLVGLSPIFQILSEKMGVRAELEEATAGNAFSVSFGSRHIVAVSSELARSLSSEEVEAVLAHELSHIKNRDSLVKGLARLARLAFPFDPVIRLVEAAVHRERELLADQASVTYTKNPMALASALLKACQGADSLVRGPGAGLCVGGSRRGLLNLHPNLEMRIDFLVNLAKRIRVRQALEARS